MKRHNPMKRHFTSSRSCSSCLATTRPKRTYGFRPHRPGRSRKLHCRRRVAGHGRLRPHPLGRHGKTDNKRHPAQDTRGQDIHSGRRDALPACVPRGRDTRLLHRPARKGGQRVLVALGLPCHGRTPLPVGPYRAKDSGM